MIRQKLCDAGLDLLSEIVTTEANQAGLTSKLEFDECKIEINEGCGVYSEGFKLHNEATEPGEETLTQNEWIGDKDMPPAVNLGESAFSGGRIGRLSDSCSKLRKGTGGVYTSIIDVSPLQKSAQE